MHSLSPEYPVPRASHTSLKGCVVDFSNNARSLQVEMQPTLPPLVAEAIPPQFRALCVNFVSQLDEDDQNRLQKLILKQSQGR